MNTTPQKPARTYHPLVNIAEWRKGCSCAPKDYPVQCEECTEGLVLAVERWFEQHRDSDILGVAGILKDLDARGALPMTVDAQAAAIIRHLEAQLYAAQDQVTGLQELMAEQATLHGPQPMDTAPTDGTRVLIHTEVHHYSADRYQICAWRMIGSQWLEARFKDGKWVEWCGNEKTSSTNTLNPIEWAPLPLGAGQ